MIDHENTHEMGSEDEHLRFLQHLVSDFPATADEPSQNGALEVSISKVVPPYADGAW